MSDWYPAITVLGMALIYLWQSTGFVDRGVKEERGQFEAGQDYDPRHVRLAVVHARQDIVGLYYLLSGVFICLAVLTALVAVHVGRHW
jgi:hypothetical protein